MADDESIRSKHRNEGAHNACLLLPMWQADGAHVDEDAVNELDPGVFSEKSHLNHPPVIRCRKTVGLQFDCHITHWIVASGGCQNVARRWRGGLLQMV